MKKSRRNVYLKAIKYYIFRHLLPLLIHERGQGGQLSYALRNFVHISINISPSSPVHIILTFPFAAVLIDSALECQVPDEISEKASTLARKWDHMDNAMMLMEVFGT